MRSSLWSFTSCLLLSASALAQTAQPSNDTVPQSSASDDATLELGIASNRMLTSYEVLPTWLKNTTHPPNITELADIHLTGELVATNDSNFNTALSNGDFAFIRCDPEVYKGNIDLEGVIKGATAKVNAEGENTLSGATGGAIVLYSLESQWCNFTPAADYTYQNVFSLVSLEAADELSNRLADSGKPSITALIQISRDMLDGVTIPNANGNGNGDDDDDNNQRAGYGPTPTTTIAMVILYVITGIIALLFLIVIISGAVRAHRHPERYRGRMLMGRPVQGRARGIAAAMLDTIPIVKFGEREAPKPVGDGAGDIEMGNVPVPHAQTDQQAVQGNETTTKGNPSTDSSAPPTSTAPATGTAADIATDPVAEAGLACSVCTDDFVKGQDTRVLPCGHKFHPECIDPWLLNVSGTCPLCRVDLHPPSSSDPTAADSTQSPSSRPSTTENSPNPAGVESAAPRDRRSVRLSGLVHQALNRGHMRDASAEQRIEALRDLREENRRAGAVTAGEQDERMRERVGRRMSRFLGRDGGNASDPTGHGTVHTGPAGSRNEDGDVTR